MKRSTLIYILLIAILLTLALTRVIAGCGTATNPPTTTTFTLVTVTVSVAPTTTAGPTTTNPAASTTTTTIAAPTTTTTTTTTSTTTTTLLVNWTRVTDEAGFSPRSAHAGVRFDFNTTTNQLVVIGGLTDSGRTQDVWASPNGTTWNGTDEASFEARSDLTAAVSDVTPSWDGMFIMGGRNDAGSLLKDCWYSIGGSVWTLATIDDAFGDREKHTSLTFDLGGGEIWVIAGNDGTSAKNDVWSSDDGQAWSPVTLAASFPARQNHASVVFDNKMWVIGGKNTSDFNDVWYSSDGANWYQATASAAWPARHSHAAVVYDGKIWVIGGSSASTAFMNDVWFSSDGVNWHRATDAEFSARREHVAINMDGKIWVLGGEDNGGNLNDVWYASP